jgi:hypothetical protein
VKKFLLILIVLAVGIQLIPVDKTNPPVDRQTALEIPKKVEPILRKACMDCHSNETVWPWYSAVAPISWSVADHVHEGRDALNFSEFYKGQRAKNTLRLRRAIEMTYSGMMPLQSYLLAHEDAKLTRDEKETLAEWFESVLVEVEHYDNRYSDGKGFSFVAKVRGNKALISIEGREDTEVEYVKTPIGIKYSGADVIFLIKGENEVYISVGDKEYTSCKKTK